MYFDDFKIGMSVETAPVTIEKEKMIAFIQMRSMQRQLPLES